MMEKGTQGDYVTKKQQVLEKFKKEFVVGNCQTDPLFHTIVELLIKGEDPYSIIERVMEERKSMVKLIEKHLELNAQPRLIKRKLTAYELREILHSLKSFDPQQQNVVRFPILEKVSAMDVKASAPFRQGNATYLTFIYEPRERDWVLDSNI